MLPAPATPFPEDGRERAPRFGGGGHPSRRLRHLPAILCLLAAACSGGPSLVDGWETDIASGEELSFAGAATILEGFDPAGGTSRFEKGDQALFGFEFHDGPRVQRWTLLLEVVEPTARENGEPVLRLGRLQSHRPDGTIDEVPFCSELLELRVTRHDAAQQEQAASTLYVPSEFLSYGLAAGCVALQGWQRGTDLSREDNTAVIRSMAACQALFDVIQHDWMLSDVLWQIARKPSLWSVVTHGGVEIGVEVSPERSVPVTGRLPGTVYRLPIAIVVNDAPALLVVADVMEPHSPCNLAAGLVGLSAQRPGDPDVRLHARLLAARRRPQ